MLKRRCPLLLQEGSPVPEKQDSTRTRAKRCLFLFWLIIIRCRSYLENSWIKQYQRCAQEGYIKAVDDRQSHEAILASNYFLPSFDSLSDSQTKAVCVRISAISPIAEYKCFDCGSSTFGRILIAIGATSKNAQQ